MKYRRRSIQIILTLFILGCITLVSCNRNSVFDQSLIVKDESWNKDTLLVFDDVKITDTTQFYNFYLVVRHTKSYPYSNLYLFMKTILPDQNFMKDTLEITLAKPDGQWLGDGFGNIRENKILLKKSFRFPLSGQYQFQFQQGMRTDVLTGVKDISIQIEKVN